MAEILPAILAHSEEEFIAKVERVRELGATLHIDVMDGVFVNNTTWAPPERMKEILGEIPFEAHLMVNDPERAVPSWLAAGAKRVIFHAEATSNGDAICRAAGTGCALLSVALNPETGTENVGALGHVTVMGVNPGRSGQPFQDVAVKKIREIKATHSGILISVDGGVKPENARMLADAGADFLVVGSAITDAPDPKKAYEKMFE